MLPLVILRKQNRAAYAAKSLPQTVCDYAVFKAAPPTEFPPEELGHVILSVDEGFFVSSV